MLYLETSNKKNYTIDIWFWPDSIVFNMGHVGLGVKHHVYSFLPAPIDPLVEVSHQHQGRVIRQTHPEIAEEYLEKTNMFRVVAEGLIADTAIDKNTNLLDRRIWKSPNHANKLENEFKKESLYLASRKVGKTEINVLTGNNIFVGVLQVNPKHIRLLKDYMQTVIKKPPQYSRRGFNCVGFITNILVKKLMLFSPLHVDPYTKCYPHAFMTELVNRNVFTRIELKGIGVHNKRFSWIKIKNIDNFPKFRRDK